MSYIKDHQNLVKALEGIGKHKSEQRKWFVAKKVHEDWHLLSRSKVKNELDLARTTTILPSSQHRGVAARDCMTKMLHRYA